MDAPTTAQEITAAYKRLYAATANALEMQQEVSAVRAGLKEAEAAHIRNGATDAGKNAEQRAALLMGLTETERRTLQGAEDALAALEVEQALAKIAVNEIRELLRLAEWWTVATYDVSPMTGREV
jgi:predicted  nucleic acid-binding Zn-ribbon protein